MRKLSKKAAKRIFIFTCVFDLLLFFLCVSNAYYNFRESLAPFWNNFFFIFPFIFIGFTSFHLQIHAVDPCALYDKRHYTLIYHVLAVPTCIMLVFSLLHPIDLDSALFYAAWLASIYANCGIAVFGIFLFRRLDRADDHCSHCGASRPEGALFCRACGKPFEKTKLR